MQIMLPEASEPVPVHGLLVQFLILSRVVCGQYNFMRPDKKETILVKRACHINLSKSTVSAKKPPLPSCVCIENMTRNLNNVGIIRVSLANQSY